MVASYSLNFPPLSPILLQKAIVLITYRVYSYSKMNFQFFLLDFCYFTNLLILLYVWLPEVVSVPAHLRGALFTICFCFANGPVLSAIVLWNNSLVPHSNDKMTSLFVHVSPSLTMWAIRWLVGHQMVRGVCVCGDCLVFYHVGHQMVRGVCVCVWRFPSSLPSIYSYSNWRFF